MEERHHIQRKRIALPSAPSPRSASSETYQIDRAQSSIIDPVSFIDNGQLLAYEGGSGREELVGRHTDVERGRAVSEIAPVGRVPG